MPFSFEDGVSFSLDQGEDGQRVEELRRTVFYAINLWQRLAKDETILIAIQRHYVWHGSLE